jgi:hypothetical protein
VDSPIKPGMYPDAGTRRFPAWTQLLCALLCLSTATLAGQLESFNVSEVDGVYETSVVALLDAPADYVYHVITDFTHIYRLNPSIVESEVMPGQASGTTRVWNRFEHCFAIFCFQVDLVEDVVEIGERQLVATAVPELSSFRSGTAMWHVRPFAGQRSRVQYRANIKPAFFVPPLIGSAMMKTMLREEMTNSLARIECQARINALNGLDGVPIRVARHTGADKDCPG